MTEQSPFSLKMGHVAVVVRDMDKTIKRLESLGIGPFKPYDFDSLSPLVGKLLFHGKPYEGKVKVFVANMGDISMEIFQPLEGISPHQEFLDKKGEGIHHIAFLMNDFEKDVARFTNQGVEVVHFARQENGGGAVYLDLGVGGLVIELEKLY
jgi:methylmalonyl-CoA/ethylmalonyl-CoA epimerase